MKLHVGDQVMIVAGKDKGKKGKVLRVLPAEQKVVVEGANLYVRHMKKQGERTGQRIQKERPLFASKVAPLNTTTGKIDRVGFKIEQDGTKVRVFKKTGKAVKYE